MEKESLELHMKTVVIDQVTKTFGTHTAVDGLSLEVPPGSVYGFIGPNGSGKTTTLRMIMNILYPNSGTIHVFGEQLAGACTDRIGYLPEERGLYKKMKVREVLEFYSTREGAVPAHRHQELVLLPLELSEEELGDLTAFLEALQGRARDAEWLEPLDLREGG